MGKLIVKGGRIIDPLQNIDAQVDLLVEDGIIKAIGKDFEEADCNVVNAERLCVAPGFVDIHVHFRDPGFTYKDRKSVV